jgi:hypothetical protein
MERMAESPESLTVHWFTQMFATKSGKMTTSLVNTLIVILFLVSGLHMELDMPMTDAIQYVIDNATIGGDDWCIGASQPLRDEIHEALVAHAGVCGFSLEFELYPEQPACFLSRVYGPLHLGDINSIQSPERSLTKLHITRLGEEWDDWEILAVKSYMYLLSDANTPLTGDWARRVVALCSERGMDVPKLFQSYLTSADAPYIAGILTDNATPDLVQEEVQYPNEFRPWMNAVVESMLGHYGVMDAIGHINEPDFDPFNTPVFFNGEIEYKSKTAEGLYQIQETGAGERIITYIPSSADFGFTVTSRATYSHSLACREGDEYLAVKTDADTLSAEFANPASRLPRKTGSPILREIVARSPSYVGLWEKLLTQATCDSTHLGVGGFMLYKCLQNKSWMETNLQLVLKKKDQTCTLGLGVLLLCLPCLNGPRFVGVWPNPGIVGLRSTLFDQLEPDEQSLAIALHVTVGDKRACVLTEPCCSMLEALN